MTYFGFLARFLLIPILILVVLHVWDGRTRRHLPAHLHSFPPLIVLLGHVIIAVIYTTPWDNYLVATQVWWYDPALVSGIVFGWVPIEEYTFFVLQPIFSGLWLLWLMKRVPKPTQALPQRGPRWGFRFVVILWVVSLFVLFSGWQRGTYLGLELSWALVPIGLQVWFGSHILWHYRRLVLWAIVPPTLYLAAADAIAIGAGTWTISPGQSLEWLLFGVLPVEEFIFFLITNILVVFGMTLALAAASQPLLKEWILWARSLRTVT